jgi:RNA polymerase sigma factor for flagellar operon FliA
MFRATERKTPRQPAAAKKLNVLIRPHHQALSPDKSNARRRASVVGIDAGSHRQHVIARRDALIEAHAGLVRSIAERLLAVCPRSIELADLIQTGMLALLHAATAYRPELHDGAPFDAYARKRIRGAMLDSISGRNWINAKLESLSDPDRSRSFGSTETDRGGEGVILEHSSPPQSMRTAAHPIEEAVDAEREMARVNDAIEYLTPEKQTLIRAYYRDGGTLEDAGAEIGLDRRRAGELLAEAISELQRILHARR